MATLIAVAVTVNVIVIAGPAPVPLEALGRVDVFVCRAMPPRHYFSSGQVAWVVV